MTDGPLSCVYLRGSEVRNVDEIAPRASTLHRRLNPEGLFRSFVCTDACYPCSLLCLISLSEHESCCQGRSEAEIGACLQGSGFPPNRDTQH
jgi:hypothetical protein